MTRSGALPSSIDALRKIHRVRQTKLPDDQIWTLGLDEIQWLATLHIARFVGLAGMVISSFCLLFEFSDQA